MIQADGFPQWNLGSPNEKVTSQMDRSIPSGSCCYINEQVFSPALGLCSEFPEVKHYKLSRTFVLSIRRIHWLPGFTSEERALRSRVADGVSGGSTPMQAQQLRAKSTHKLWRLGCWDDHWIRQCQKKHRGDPLQIPLPWTIFQSSDLFILWSNHRILEWFGIKGA